MPPERSPNGRALQLISAVSFRRLLLHVAIACAVGAAAAVAFGWLGAWTGAEPRPWLRASAGVLVTVAAIAVSRRFRSRWHSAAEVEKVRPECRNLLVTAEELERHPDRASSHMSSRVLAAADRALEGVRPGHVVPGYRIAAVALVATLLAFLSAPDGQRVIREAVARTVDAIPTLAASPRVRVRVEPPAYSRQPMRTLDAPSRIEALEGSRITFEMTGSGRVRFGNSRVDGAFVAKESGYFAIENDVSTERVLIPLTVTPDRSPSVRIEAPGKDLLLTAASRNIPVTIEAEDDLGLENLELRYTKVSGTGEQFEFVEGAAPVRVQRSSGRQWRASGELALTTLRLGPGDSIVYRAVARDHRPGSAGVAASETYFVEIAGPGQVALEGVDMPPELERYAMSQQMIVLKIERLLARAPKIPREGVVEESAGIAAEQRTVRANFVFLLGGHVEDEEVEAEQSHEIQEGRLENTARKDINTAISHMTRAEQGLTAVNLAGALPPARSAVEALQRAFGKSRYLLRSLAVRSRLDPSRRLTGNLAEAGNWQRASSQPDARNGEAARTLLDRLIETAAALRSGQRVEPGTLQSLAEAALGIDSTAAVWRDVAARVSKATDARELQEVIAKVAVEAQRGTLPRTPLADRPSEIGRAFELERRK